MCYDFNINDIGGGGGGGGGGDIMAEGRRIFRIVLTPAGFPNFWHTFCPTLSGQSLLKNDTHKECNTYILIFYTLLASLTYPKL